MSISSSSSGVDVREPQGVGALLPRRVLLRHRRHAVDHPPRRPHPPPLRLPEGHVQLASVISIGLGSYVLLLFGECRLYRGWMPFLQGPQFRPRLRDGPRLRPHLHPGHQLGAADGDALPHRLVPLPALRHSGTGIDHSTYEARLDVYDRLLNLMLLIMFFGGNFS